MSANYDTLQNELKTARADLEYSIECNGPKSAATGYARETLRKAQIQVDDFGTPNYCGTCSPMGIGYCRCEIACNE